MSNLSLRLVAVHLFNYPITKLLNYQILCEPHPASCRRFERASGCCTSASRGVLRLDGELNFRICWRNLNIGAGRFRARGEKRRHAIAAADIAQEERERGLFGEGRPERIRREVRNLQAE